jgi:hypothetical protein
MIGPEAYAEAYGVEFDGSAYHEVVFEQRHWDNRNYLVPIQYEEMQKNTSLIQNPGY